MGMMLQQHGTELNRLKPVNIVQAAEADLRLKVRKKENKADPEAMYSFARKHVNRATSVGYLIALAYFEPGIAATTDKKSTFIVYKDRDLLRDALNLVLNSEDA